MNCYCTNCNLPSNNVINFSQNLCANYETDLSAPCPGQQKPATRLRLAETGEGKAMRMKILDSRLPDKLDIGKFPKKPKDVGKVVKSLEPEPPEEWEKIKVSLKKFSKEEEDNSESVYEQEKARCCEEFLQFIDTQLGIKSCTDTVVRDPGAEEVIKRVTDECEVIEHPETPPHEKFSLPESIKISPQLRKTLRQKAQEQRFSSLAPQEFFVLAVKEYIGETKLAACNPKNVQIHRLIQEQRARHERRKKHTLQLQQKSGQPIIRFIPPTVTIPDSAKPISADVSISLVQESSEMERFDEICDERIRAAEQMRLVQEEYERLRKLCEEEGEDSTNGCDEEEMFDLMNYLKS